MYCPLHLRLRVSENRTLPPRQHVVPSPARLLRSNAGFDDDDDDDGDDDGDATATLT